MPGPQFKETQAFIDSYDDMLESTGVPRLTQEQRDVLAGFLDEVADGEPRLIEALQPMRETWEWLLEKKREQEESASVNRVPKHDKEPTE